MGTRLLAFMDLGDAFTKCLTLGNVRSPRVRFPSVVATRLVSGGSEMTQLLVDRQRSLPRPASFDPASFPRTRSYQRGPEFVRQVQARPPEPGSRFAGRMAAAYGADRRLLGRYPTEEVVDALVHKAFILSGAETECHVDVVYVLDTGAKAAAIEQYARLPDRSVSVELRSYKNRKPRTLALTLRGTVVDAPDCIAAALPPELRPPRTPRLLVVDIGFFRAKLVVISGDGCEYQIEVDDLGTSDLVRRILRDGQDQGLVEDEFAVIHALENSSGASIDVANRRFAVAVPLAKALAALEEELARVVQKAILDHFGRHGHACRAMAIIGGGAVLAGSGLKARIESAGLGFETIWATPDPNYLLLEGAKRLQGTTST